MQSCGVMNVGGWSTWHQAKTLTQRNHTNAAVAFTLVTLSFTFSLRLDTVPTGLLLQCLTHTRLIEVQWYHTQNRYSTQILMSSVKKTTYPRAVFCRSLAFPSLMGLSLPSPTEGEKTQFRLLDHAKSSSVAWEKSWPAILNDQTNCTVFKWTKTQWKAVYERLLKRSSNNIWGRLGMKHINQSRLSAPLGI